MKVFAVCSALLSSASLVQAHFRVVYPSWRGDSFKAPASQWSWPCAGVNQTESTNRTQWPLSGGSVAINGSHEYATTFVNLGLGNIVSSFNVTLLDSFNQTGAGVLCFKQLAREAIQQLGVAPGTNATLQIIQLGHGGNALYNCADITFTDTAQLLSVDQCKNSTGVGGAFLTNASPNSPATESPTTPAKPNAAGTLSVPGVLIAVVGGLVAFVL